MPTLKLVGAPPHRPDPATQKLLVSLATYNERGNLAALVAAIHAQVAAADVLITDDNSPDGTGRVADELAAADRRVKVIHRHGKQGLGTAMLGAMRYAMDGGYDLFLNLDADFSHPPRYLPGLVAGMRDADVVIGSRYVAGGGAENWPASRQLISRGVNGFVRVALRMPVRDASGSFRCYRVSKLREAQLERVRSRGYSFMQEVLFRCHKAGCDIRETPIVFENRKEGTSKVDGREAARSLSMLAWLGVRSLVGLER